MACTGTGIFAIVSDVCSLPSDRLQISENTIRFIVLSGCLCRIDVDNGSAIGNGKSVLSHLQDWTFDGRKIMKSLTKNELHIDTIQKMVMICFGSQKILKCEELTEGYFNMAYQIEFTDGQKVILKVAPKPEARIMTYEKNIMLSEVMAMEKASEKEEIPVPKLLGFDDSCSICDSPYFFMEKLEGNSLCSVKDTLTTEQLKNIYIQTGKFNRKINEITMPLFGYPGQMEFQGYKWFPIFLRMMEAGIQDAEKGNVELGIPAAELLSGLKQDWGFFEEVTIPRLVHWDLWDGNIFIHEGKITGLIDWERSIWGDPLMEFGFRTYDQNEDFLAGYGIKKLTYMQKRRVLWYDVYLLLLMSLECEYRGYETMDMYHWATKMLRQQFQKI